MVERAFVTAALHRLSSYRVRGSPAIAAAGRRGSDTRPIAQVIAPVSLQLGVFRRHRDWRAGAAQVGATDIVMLLDDEILMVLAQRLLEQGQS